MKKKFLIWSIEHQAWWSDRGADYAKDIDAADRYSMKEALDIVLDAHIGHHLDKPPKEAMIPLDAFEGRI